MNKSMLPAIALLRSVVRYEPETGAFFWCADRSAQHRAGTSAGFVADSGYIRIRVFGRLYYAQCLAWALQTGEWPVDEVDHQDLNRANNRWSNLRAATRGQNQSNTRTYRQNAAGLKGVYSYTSNPSKFMSSIRKDGKLKYLGVFDTAETAHQAYAKAAQEMHGEFGRVS